MIPESFKDLVRDAKNFGERADQHVPNGAIEQRQLDAERRTLQGQHAREACARYREMIRAGQTFRADPMI